MFSEQFSFSNSSMCGASGAACTSSCPYSFKNSVFLLSTAFFAVFVLFLGVILSSVNVTAVGITILSLIMGFAHILRITNLKLNNR
ncbi:MAG: hypothetical protein ACI4IF_05375 [Acutalibacteraceae bacterium]